MNLNSMTENQRKDDLRQFLKKKIERMKEEIPIAIGRKRKVFPEGFSLCEKTIAEERGILMPQ